jgi:DNA-binding NtrC family response regulator
MATPTVSPASLRALMEHTWPGNVRELKNVAERLVVRNRNGRIEPDDLPIELFRQPSSPIPDTAPQRAAYLEMLFDRVVVHGESFWDAVYPVFMDRDMTRDDLRLLVRFGLERTAGSYGRLLELFNIPATDHKRLAVFLRKHQCAPNGDALPEIDR